MEPLLTIGPWPKFWLVTIAWASLLWLCYAHLRRASQPVDLAAGVPADVLQDLAMACLLLFAVLVLPDPWTLI